MSNERHGWHLTCEAMASDKPTWHVRYFQDGKVYLCDPASYERRCNDELVPFNGDLIMIGPDMGNPSVKIEPRPEIIEKWKRGNA
jgi:hypothetical protein